MTIDTNYIILRATPTIKKQMRFMFPLYVLFIINMFRYFIKDVLL